MPTKEEEAHTQAYQAYWHQRLEDGKGWASRRAVIKREHGPAIMDKPTPEHAEAHLKNLRRENREKRRVLDQQRDADVAKVRAAHADKAHALHSAERTARDFLRDARQRARHAQDGHRHDLQKKYAAERPSYYKTSDTLRAPMDEAREALQAQRSANLQQPGPNTP